MLALTPPSIDHHLHLLQKLAYLFSGLIISPAQPHPAPSADQSYTPATVDADQASKTTPNPIMSEPNGTSVPLADLANASATQVRPGGAPARVYLNDKIVPHLLEGMKSVAKDQ